jgi:thiamine biosynthesis lipoprotein
MLSEIRQMMNMPITVEIVDPHASSDLVEDVYAHFARVERQFSVFCETSEVSRFNQGYVKSEDLSADLREVMELADLTKRETSGYFDIRRRDGTIDPSGIVKGWAIFKAARLLTEAGVKNYLIDAGGDIQTAGKSADGSNWAVGIRNPFNEQEIIKALRPNGRGVATSGTYARGQHIWNPKTPGRPVSDIVSLTVIGPNVLEADRFATAAFAMGKEGIYLIEEIDGLEGYVIEATGVATATTDFGAYVIS